MNPSDEAITDASLTDVMPDGLEIDADSIKLNDLTVGLDGTLTQGDNFSVNPTIDGQNLDIPFDKIDPYKGYRVEYTTTIIDKSATQFTNDANLVDGDIKLPAEATVDIERSDYVEKYGTEKDNGNIEWTIDVNKDGGSIDESIIEDELPEGLNLETIEILKLTQAGDNWNESESDKTADEFPVNLGKLTSDDAYRIKVETSIDYSEVNEGDYEQATEFTNKTTLKDGDNELDSDDAKVNIVRKPIPSKSGSDVKIDHEEGKKLDWKVTVNEANHTIDDAVVTDTLPAGLTIDKNDIVVKKGDEDVTDSVTINVPDNDGSNPIEVTINLGDITEEHTITYLTKVRDFSKDNFTNGVTLGGTGVGPEDSTDENTTKPKGNYYNKKDTARDADKQIISWKSEVNPHREAISELVITDTFSKKGLFLLEDTVEIKIGSNELTKGTDFTLSPDSTYKEGFKIEFDDSVFPIQQKLTLTYDTSYNLKDVDPNEGVENKRYNDVNFTGKTVNNNEIDVDKDDTVTVGTTTVNSGKKLGELVSLDEDGNQVNGWHSGNERKLEWEVYTNYLKQDLGEDVTIEDVLGYDGEVDIDNLEVKEYKVNKKGETTLGNAIDASKYDVSATEDGFTLTFNEAVTERYAVVFTTDVPEISKGIYKNTATTKVGDKEYPYTGSIDFDKADKNLSKEAIDLDNNEVFTDDEINWEIKINESLSFVEEKVKVIDTISAGMEYLDDSFELYKLEGSEEVLVDESEYDLAVNRDTDDDTTDLKIEFKGSISSTYVMKYKTIVTETDGKVNNKVDFSGSNFDKKTIESEKLTAQQFSFVGGDPTRGEVKVIKQDTDDEDKKLPGAEFEFYYLLNGEKQYVKAEDGSTTHVTKEDGTIDFVGLLTNRTYYLEEVNAPDGYEITNPEIIEIDDLQAVGEDRENVYEVSVENTKLVNFSGIKTWLDNDSDERPEKITVELSGDNGYTEEQDVSEKDDWIYEFTDLTKYDEDGTEILYTIDEIEVDGYETKVDGHNITNLRVGETAVSGEKTWIEEDDQYRPESITVQLLANGEEETTQEVSEETDWKYNFTDLPKYDEEGKEINYTIEELAVPGYDTSVEDHDITNTQQTTELSGTKTWIDNDDATEDRPESITVQVMNPTDSEPVQEKEITADDEWNYTFADLPKYNQEGEEIDYTVTEVVPEGYDVTVDGNDLSNLRTGTTEVTVNKSWKDEDKSDRPDSIKVNLKQNGTFLKSAAIEADDDWSYTFTDLPEFDEQGKAYDYTVTEQDVPGYDSEVDGFDITNTRADEKSIEITKAWLDDNSEERPETIEVELFRSITDGEKESVDTYEVKASDDWSIEIQDLPAFDSNGKAYTYEVEEEVIEGYETEVNGLDITNLRVDETDVSGTKTWIEEDDQYRQESITVQLLANGEKETTKEVSQETDWTYSFTGLDKYDSEGKQINYTIEELSVPGYEADVDGYDIINTQQTTELSGTKTWIDNDDATEDRPESITVQGMNPTDSEPVQEKEITADDEWNYTFADLPKYNQEGEEIDYTVTEVVPEGYDVTVDGNDLSNFRTGTTEVTVDKSWKDEDTSDRPDSIKVNLLQNGKVFTVEEIEAEDDWSHTFTDLPEFDEQGKAYEYTVTEQDVPGYDSEVDGFDITNTRADEKSIEITKSWLDDNSEERPETIEVELFRSIAKGEKESVDTYEVKASDDWSIEIQDLPAFDSNGKAYTYEIEEKAVENYESEVNGFDITNLRVGETDVSGTKTWMNDDESTRPESITVQLFADNEEIDSQNVTAETDWNYAFKDLPKYDELGKEIAYTIGEIAVENYETSVNNYDLTNTFIPEEEQPEDPEDPEVPGESEDPEKPDKPDDSEKPSIPEVPGTPGDSEKPGKPSDSDKPGDANGQTDTGETTDKDDGKPGKGLPSTASDMYNLIVIGLLMIVVGAGLFIVKRKRTNE